MEEISKSVENVSNLFMNAKCLGGKQATGKSSSQVVKPSRKRTQGSGVFSKFWNAIDKYEKDQLGERSIIVSCSEANVTHVVKSLDQPFLLISTNDLNSKDFKNQLGKILLEYKATICIELEGLSREGSIRLGSLLTSVTSMFDSRVRVVVFGEEGVYTDIDEFSQRHFVMENFGESSKRLKKEYSSSKSQECPGVEFKKIELLEKELDDIKSENLLLKSDQVKKASELMKLGSEVKDLESECLELKVDLIKVKDKLKRDGCELEAVLNQNETLSKDLSALKEKLLDGQETADEENRKLLSQLKKNTDELFEMKRTHKDSSGKDLQMIETLKSQNQIEKQAQEKCITELKSLKHAQEKDIALLKSLKEDQVKIIKELKDEKEDHDEAIVKWKIEKEALEEKIKKLEAGKEVQERTFTEMKSAITELENKTNPYVQTKVLVAKDTQTEGSVVESSCFVIKEPVCVQTQTDNVVISKPTLSVLKDELVKYGSFGAVNQAYKSIKNLKTKEMFTKDSVNVRCHVEIIRGNHIMKYPVLTHFYGDGSTEKEAKCAAFAYFVSSVLRYED